MKLCWLLRVEEVHCSEMLVAQVGWLVALAVSWVSASGLFGYCDQHNMFDHVDRLCVPSPEEAERLVGLR